jgi:hypothetical protein
MHRVLVYGAVLGLSAGGAAAEAAERRTIGRVAAGLQLGGFYDLGDPALELRGWRGRLGGSVSYGRHLPDPSEPGFVLVRSDPGKQVTGGVLLAFLDPRGARAVAVKPYVTGGFVHVTQAKATWELPQPSGSRRGRTTIGETAVEGGTGTWPFGGAGVEIGFRKVPGLAFGSEALVTFSGAGGPAPALRFGLRYYPW